MNHLPSYFSAALFAVAAAAMAQVPEDAKAAKEVHLMQLRSFLGTRVVRSEPLGVNPAAETEKARGSSHDVEVASVRDVVFGLDGTMQTYVVVPAQKTAAASAAPEQQARLLPIRDARWRDGVLVTELDAGRIAALPAHDAKKPAKPSSEPPATVLATSLLEARAYRDGAKPPLGEGAPVLWLAPAAQQLAFVAIPVKKDDHRLAPWSVLQVTSKEGQIVLDITGAAERLADAPKVKDPTIPPTAAERSASGKHFGVEVPARDAKSGSPGSTAQK
jgi:hypothetical protein